MQGSKTGKGMNLIMRRLSRKFSVKATGTGSWENSGRELSCEEAGLFNNSCQSLVQGCFGVCRLTSMLQKPLQLNVSRVGTFYTKGL